MTWINTLWHELTWRELIWFRHELTWFLCQWMHYYEIPFSLWNSNFIMESHFHYGSFQNALKVTKSDGAKMTWKKKNLKKVTFKTASLRSRSTKLPILGQIWITEGLTIFFEVLHASLAQKLTNLEFLTIIFSDVAIGHFARSLRPN